MDDLNVKDIGFPAIAVAIAALLAGLANIPTLEPYINPEKPVGKLVSVVGPWVLGIILGLVIWGAGGVKTAFSGVVGGFLAGSFSRDIYDILSARLKKKAQE
mgnify:CR=1 FL=1